MSTHFRCWIWSALRPRRDAGRGAGPLQQRSRGRHSARVPETKRCRPRFCSGLKRQADAAEWVGMEWDLGQAGLRAAKAGRRVARAGLRAVKAGQRAAKLGLWAAKSGHRTAKVGLRAAKAGLRAVKEELRPATEELPPAEKAPPARK